ncbi:MAG: SUMF1/EgtB/PvdO family nonheme iron enzyme [Phycisphaerales bacterium]|nr:SUMF1/EgtB/PvdO family nonheme iron enzyme [Phycisphaerales bacterium]
MTPRRRIARARVIACLVLGLGAAPALAQPDPSGIDFVTIGAPGNAAYQAADPRSFEHNRGSVAYEYKIGRYEMTTGQWVEFMNAALNRPDPIPWVEVPTMWAGGQFAPFNASPANAIRPAGGATWRTCAIFTNWLHNNKSLERAAFLSGAYDVSTFGNDGMGGFTDQQAHSPGARYWIPTMDEWLKAAHYDPSKQNPDGSVGGWWQYSNGTDSPYLYGPPPGGHANAGFETPNPYEIPLGSYEITSPWGLYDVAGATVEYTESIFPTGARTRYRVVDGSGWGLPAGDLDTIGGLGGEVPSSHLDYFGFRIAAAVPSPASGVAIAVGCIGCFGRRRRQTHEIVAPRRRDHRIVRPCGLGSARRCPVDPSQCG